MTVFEKAVWLRRMFFLALPLFFAAFILVIVTQSKWALLALVCALAVPFLALFVSGRWPSCPACGEQVLEKIVTGGANGGGLSLQAPPRECGYCGLDLTLPYNPE